MTTRREFDAYRKELDDAADAAAKDLRRLWSSIGLEDFDEFKAALLQLLPGIVSARGAEAAAIAAMFYGKLRSESLPGPHPAQLAGFNGGARLAKAVEGARRFFGQGGVGRNSNSALKALERAVRYEVLGMASATVARSAALDKAKPKCASIPSLGCKCTFCLSFAAMGFSFNYRRSARKRNGVWHDNCRCQMVPAFSKDPKLDWYDPERCEKLRDHIKGGRISFQKGAGPLEKELDVAVFLADAGHEVRFLNASGKRRTADCTVDGVQREMKIPEGNANTNSLGENNIEKQFRYAVYPELQSDKLIISHHLIADRIGFDEWREMNLLEWKHWPQISELWLVDSGGRILPQ